MFLLITGSLLLPGSFPTACRAALAVTSWCRWPRCWLVFFYCVDFAHYAYLSQRLSASVLNYLTDTGISAGLVWQTYPVLRILLILIAGTWLIRRVVKMVFRADPAEGERGRLHAAARTAWFVAAFPAYGIGHFRPGRAISASLE